MVESERDVVLTTEEKKLILGWLGEYPAGVDKNNWDRSGLLTGSKNETEVMLEANPELSEHG